MASLLAPRPAPGESWAARDQPVRIGIVVDGPWLGNAGVLDLSKREILALTEGEFDVRFPESAYLIGDWTVETARAHLDRLLADPEVDLVIAWGLLSSHAVCCYADLPKPVIAPVIIDPRLQGLPLADGASGVKNLSYVAFPDNLLHELEVFREIVPFRRVAILANAALVEAIPELEIRTAEAIYEMGVEFEYVPVGYSAEEILATISDAVDAVYVWPQLQLPAEENARLLAGFKERRLPSFSALGQGEVEAGMLATVGSPEFFPRLARRIALNLQRILLGEEAGSIPVSFSVRDQLLINMATAREIGVSPRWEVLIEARLLYAEEIDEADRLTLNTTVERAIAANLDLAAERRALAAGAQEVRRARSALLPQLEAGATALQIDDDRAAASFGSQPERSTTASATLSQLLYSDSALANVEVQAALQQLREHELESLRLDIALETAVTYLGLLRVRSLLQVRRNNLETTRSNLELARIRRSLGAANPAEVYRWESQIATDRKALVEAVADLRAAEITVNRLLHWRLEERFLAAEVSLEDETLIVGQERFTGYTETPRRFEAFRHFVAAEGLAASPELKQLDALIAAQERALAAARRAYWAPTVGLRAAFDELLSKGGAGSESGFSFPGLALPQADDSSWSVAFSASLPLFAGGARAAERVQAEEDLERLRLERASAAEKIEQGIRAGLQQVRATFTGIELSRQAAEAANQNLDLVSDAYARGAVSILDLLDAQTAALNADEVAAAAVYDFFVELFQVQRTANRLDFLIEAAERDAWYDRLEAFFSEAGIPPLEP